MRQFELGRAVEIPLRRLRMTPGEVGRWAVQAWGIHLSRDEARSLWRLTHGWPVALVLLGQRLLSSSVHPRRHDLLVLLDKGRHLTEYLSRNFFESLEEDAGEVLKRGALVSRVSFPRDLPLFGDGVAAEAALQKLTQRGFLVAKSGPRTYTLHPLVRGFAEREVRREDPERALAERGRVAAHLESCGNLREAASMYLSIGDAPAAARVLRRLACTSLNVSIDFAGKGSTRDLPDELLVGDPWLLIAKGRAFQAMARFPEAEAYYTRALSLARESDDRLAVLQSLLSIAFCKYLTGRLESSIEHVCLADEIAEGRIEKSEILAVKANLHFGKCDWDRAVEYMEGARHLRQGDQDFDARIHIYQSHLFALRGRMATASQWAEKACETAAEGSAEVRASALHHAAAALCSRGEYAQAEVKCRAAQAVARSRSFRFLEGPMLLTEAAIVLGLGERRRGLLALKHAMALCVESHDIQSELWAADMLGDFYRRNLNAGKAAQQHEHSLRRAKERSLAPYEQVRPLVGLGLDLAVLGREEEALERLADAVRQTRRHGLEGLLAQALLFTGWLQARRGEERPAARTIHEAMRFAGIQENVHFFLQESSVALPIYALAHRLGEADWLAERVVPRLDARNRRYLQKLATGPLYPTDVPLGPARLSRIGVGREPVPTEGSTDQKLGMLTARELEILRLIALGMSNKTIGQKLFITEKTVKTHAYHIFGKLEVSSRVQAALLFQHYQRTAGRTRRPGVTRSP